MFWERGVTSINSPNFFMLWGIPFVLIGQYLIWGRFFYDSWLKRRTVYAVTTQRVIVTRYGFKFEQTDRTLSGLPAVSLTLQTDGVGTIDFSSESGSNPFLTKSSSSWQVWSALHKFAFVDIADARDVRLLILKQQQKLTTGTGLPEERA